MPLTAQQRLDLAAEIMRELSASRTPCPIAKADLKAAINAIDDWCDTNAASFNTAIPLPARTALSSGEKARLLARVATRRYSG